MRSDNRAGVAMGARIDRVAQDACLVDFRL